MTQIEFQITDPATGACVSRDLESDINFHWYLSFAPGPDYDRSVFILAAASEQLDVNPAEAHERLLAGEKVAIELPW